MPARCKEGCVCVCARAYVGMNAVDEHFIRLECHFDAVRVLRCPETTNFLFRTLLVQVRQQGSDVDGGHQLTKQSWVCVVCVSLFKRQHEQSKDLSLSVCLSVSLIRLKLHTLSPPLPTSLPLCARDRRAGKETREKQDEAKQLYCDTPWLGRCTPLLHMHPALPTGQR